MYAQVKRAGTIAVRQSKSFVVAVAVIGVWFALFAGVITSISQPNPIHASIEKVLSTPNSAGPSPALVAARR